MQKVFTNFASSRFVDQDAVIAGLKQCAARLKSQRKEIKGVYLFGSFASGKATPRSDADVVIEIMDNHADSRSRVADETVGIFLDAAVPVEVFILTSSQLTEGERLGTGVAGAVGREGLRLA
jgi:predicted nucleotidyltransferase